MTEELLATLTTDGNGECEFEYTGTGAGLLNLLAKYKGIIQSETFSILDCYKMDNGTTSDHSDIWTVGYGTLTRADEYSTLVENSTSDGLCAISNIPLTSYHIEVDVYQVDGSTSRTVLQILNNDYSPVTGGYIDGVVGEWKHISVDYTDLAVNTRVRLIAGSDCTELRFKNFKIYPI